jgi:hypothetical protein
MPTPPTQNELLLLAEIAVLRQNNQAQRHALRELNRAIRFALKTMGQPMRVKGHEQASPEDEETIMTITPELFSATERTLHASGRKPKDAAAIITRLETDFQIKCSVEGGLLSMTQGADNTPVSVGTVLQSYSAKHPRDFFGGAGEVNFKDDPQGDHAAKIRFINEHGGEAWARLPLMKRLQKPTGRPPLTL